MKKILLIAACFVLAGSMTSCNKMMMKQNSPVYSLTNSRVSNGELQTVLETRGQLTGEVSGKFSLFGRKIKGNNHRYIMDNTSSMKPRGVNAAKAAALYKALEGSGCDIILAPVYNVQTKGRKFTVKVTGIGAKINGVEQRETVDQVKVVYNK